MTKLTLDTETNILTLEDAGQIKTLDLYSKGAFEAISRQGAPGLEPKIPIHI